MKRLVGGAVAGIAGIGLAAYLIFTSPAKEVAMSAARDALNAASVPTMADDLSVAYARIDGDQAVYQFRVKSKNAKGTIVVKMRQEGSGQWRAASIEGVETLERR